MSRWPEESRPEREAFWRSHLEGWRRSELNQREYCEAQGLSLKRFGNWRMKFKQEDVAPRKLLYRRGGGLGGVGARGAGVLVAGNAPSAASVGCSHSDYPPPTTREPREPA